mgnify:CR=1 FL=1
MFHLAPFHPHDADAVEALLDRAFGPGRLAKSSYAFRRGIEPVAGLRFVAHGGEGLVGTIACWPIVVGEAGTPALLLGPVGVEPGLQGRGIGAALIERTLNGAAALGHRLVLLVGDPVYYARFGFRSAAPHGIRVPAEPPGRLQYFELVPEALDGVSGTVMHRDAMVGGASPEPRRLGAGALPEPT